ncbi:Putative all-trans-retinol 13,14-reductase [Seminavis robusta]|uniref:All-trans-retinol 13,14-reductase n=1 Tax=Seminavis robusta TaxID=568900 RepID=A0A9N8EA70_9STRA|nr:Putative all-trans-retinol 13,14-reductase [Seminavis robusta]|eukprot:Sro666_g184070.1 Putative all-trans-retinol 13,14-reductase (692) ;mRNA; r:46565-48640
MRSGLQPSSLAWLAVLCLAATYREIGHVKAWSQSVRSTSSSKNSRLFSSVGEEQPPSKNPWREHDKSLLHNVYHKSKLPSNEVDYVIVGSGIGGLWLAACLAKFNISSVVLEQHYIVGGFQHTFWRGPYEFVPGLHYIANLELCAPLYDMVATPSAIYHHQSNATKATTKTRAITYHQAGNSVQADGGNLVSHELKIGDLPVMQVQEGRDNVRKELARVFPSETKAIDEFIELMEKAKWQAGQFATFKIFPPWLQFLTSQLLCSTYIRYASQTTEEVLGALTNDGRLKTVLSAFGGDLGESIGEGSFVMQAAVLGHVLEGCYYPEGGPIQFARGLVPTIRQAGGDVFVKARVDQILVDESDNKPIVRRVQLANGDILSSRLGVVSDCGFRSSLKLLPPHAQKMPGVQKLHKAVEESSGGISHVFTFVGLNASFEELGLKSSSYYYIPWNTTDQNMDATAIQDFYRDTLLDPDVLDVSAGIVFASAKDPTYSEVVMPGKSTVIVFSEAKNEDFLPFLDSNKPSAGLQGRRTEEYKQAKDLIERKMMRSLLLNFPHLEPYIDVVEVGTPLTLFDYTRRFETLGLRHTPQRMCDMDLRPACTGLPGLYFTGQDVAFAGWAGALAGAMVTAQQLLGYTLLDFMNKKTLLRDLGNGDLEDTIQQKVQDGTAASPVEVMIEVAGNAWRHFRRQFSNG